MTAPAERGSVVIEAMIAAAIVAAMLGVTFETIQTTSAHARAVDDRRRAMLVAQSALAEVGPVIPAEPGTTDGAAGDLGWRVAIDHWGDGAPSDAGRLGLVTVTVHDAGGRSLAVLRSLRLGR
ncbi:MAG: hypothetical protein ACRYG4_28780 [Janthinobacterium lividum]